jgi:hypothetical protein
VAFRKQHVCYGQAGTMVLERLTELEHTAVARMDQESGFQKATCMLWTGWYNGSRATYRNRAWCRGEAW